MSNMSSNVVPAPDDALVKLNFDDLPEDLPGTPQLTLKNMANNMPSVSGSMSMLDSALFDFGQTTEKPKKQSSSYEVDMNLPFPIKLHYILSNPEFSDYITWLPHGRAWKVTDQKGFESKVIPKFFRSDRMASFMRQVNGWAFNRITEGPDMNAYYHEVSSKNSLEALAPNFSFLTLCLVIFINQNRCFSEAFLTYALKCVVHPRSSMQLLLLV